MRPCFMAGGVLAVALTGCREEKADTGRTEQGLTGPSLSIVPDEPTTTDDLAVLVEEADGLAISYAWSQDGDPRDDLISQSVSADNTARGEVWSVTVTVSNGSAAEENTAEVTIANSPPTATAEAANDAPGSDEDVEILVEGADADGDTVSFSVVWDVDGSASDHAELTVPAALTAKGEVWTGTVIPNDGTDDGEPITVSVRIGNEAPVADSVTIDAKTATEEDTLSATANGSDADGDALGWVYTWTVNGYTALIGEDNTLDGTYFNKGDAVAVSAYASDGYADSDTVSSAAVSIVNTPPTFTDIDLSPGTIVEASTVTCLGEGWSDPDGDTEDYRISWEVNGTEVSTSDTLDGADFSKGDAITCVLIANDGEEDGTEISKGGTVGNTPPDLSTVGLDNGLPTTETTLGVVLGSAVDDDGDAISYTYQWYVNSTAASTAETLAPGTAQKGDSVYVEVTPTDGTDAGHPVSTVAVAVVNAPPTVTDVILSPDPAVAGDTITASITASDPDGDALRYTYLWRVNGSTAGTSATLTGVVKGDVVSVEVTPDDGTDRGDTYTSDRIEVSNTAPTAPAISVVPTAPEEGVDDLICEITTASSDADGETISYSFSWSVDGARYPGAVDTYEAGDTIEAADTFGDEEWTCTVIASDSEDDSAAVTASVTVAGSSWSGARTFTPCGASGDIGPSASQCSSAYSGTALDGEVSVSGGIQGWTVPSDGDYRITAAGAMGASGTTSYQGGAGAMVEGVFALSAGDTLYVVVGQPGEGGGSGSNGGGGGGTFVVDSTGAPLVIAGGGGGTRHSAFQDGCDGRADQYGGAGSGSTSTSSCGASSDTLGYGGTLSASTYGSGGGGLLGDGTGDYASSNGGGSWSSGLGGGISTSGCGDAAAGGFGGGGSGRGCSGGGGGGGFTGGQGGFVGGGGGSFVETSASDRTLVAGDNLDEGYVIIDQE